MKNYKKIISILLASVLAFGAIGCGNSSGKKADAAESKSESENSNTTDSSEEGNKSTELKKVTIANIGTDGTLTEVARIAQSKGFFEEELAKVGYEPDYQGFAQAGPAINEAFAGGTVDLAVYGDMPAITAKSNGVDVKVIASVTSQLDYAVLAAENTDISSVADLKGKKIAVGFGTVTYKYLDELLNQNGLSIDDVEIVNTSVDGPTMLSSNQIDAFITQYSAGVAYQAGNIGKIIFSTKDNEELSGQLLLTARADFLETDREAAVAAVKALYDAYEYAKENPDEVYGNLATENFPEAIQKQVYTDQSFAAFNPAIGDVTIEKLTDIAQFQKDNQLISSEVDINDLIDKSIEEEATK